MSLIILLCVLLQAFSTCSLVDSGAQPQGILREENILEDLKNAFIETSQSAESPPIFSSSLMKLEQVAEEFWSLCLDKMSAYSRSQGFFKNTLSDFVDRMGEYPKLELPTQYTLDTLPIAIKIFCVLQSCIAYLEDLKNLAKCYKADDSSFEGLSDEFLTLAADYMRSTVNIRKLDLIMGRPDIFKDIEHPEIDASILQSRLLVALVHSRGLISGLQKVDLMDIYHRFSSAVKAARRTMVPANEALVSFLTGLILWEPSLLALNASKCIFVPCSRLGLAKSASNLLAGIEAITIPLYRAHCDLDRAVVERRERGEILYNGFLQSLFAYESILVKPDPDNVRRVSETLSELTNTLFDIFLRGEDESWAFGIPETLLRVQTLWDRAVNSSNCALTSKEAVSRLKYSSYLWADLWMVFHVLIILDKIEDPLAFDQPTREKFVEFWREAQALTRLLEWISMVEKMARRLEAAERILTPVVMNKLLSEVFDEQINCVRRHGVNFQLGKYHQFIDEMPEQQREVAQVLRKLSDDLSRTIVNDAMVSRVESLFSLLDSSRYTRLKGSLKQLFARPPRLTQPKNLPSRPAESSNKQPKKRGRKLTRKIKHCKVAAAPEASASTNTQVFVRAGPQHVEADEASDRAVDGLELFKESFEKSWTLVKKSQNRQTFGSLASQPARKVLQEFLSSPLGWDGVPPVDPRDMRSDKTKLKIATFNVEWLFLFNLSTEKLEGRIKWKSLKDAWDHIKDVADAIRKINADIICLCEVQDMRILSILVQLLPELNYRAYLIPNHDSLGQNVGILTRVDTFVSVYRIEEWSFPKNIVFHLHLENGRGGLVDLVLTGVHLISSTAEADHVERARHREDQARALKQHLKFYYGASGDVIHFVLGDFNMVDPELPSVEAADSSEKALEVIKHEEFRLFNIMGSKSKGVCHILTSHPDLAADSQICNLNAGSTSYRLERVSDHSPVVTTIHLPPTNK